MNMIIYVDVGGYPMTEWPIVVNKYRDMITNLNPQWGLSNALFIPRNGIGEIVILPEQTI